MHSGDLSKVQWPAALKELDLSFCKQITSAFQPHLSPNEHERTTSPVRPQPQTSFFLILTFFPPSALVCTFAYLLPVHATFAAPAGCPKGDRDMALEPLETYRRRQRQHQQRKQQKREQLQREQQQHRYIALSLFVLALAFVAYYYFSRNKTPQQLSVEDANL